MTPSPPGPGPRGALCVGLATLDVVLGVDRVPGPDEKVVATSQLVAAGGPAANAAVACAWAGVPARLLTVLGADPLARVVAADLASHGVAVIDADPARFVSPAVAAVLVTEATGARAVVSRTDRDLVPAAHAETAVDVAAALEGVSVVLADGHHVALAEPVLRAARAAGIPTLLDAGTWRPAFEVLVPLADTVVASAAFRPPGTEGSPDVVLADLLRRGVRLAAITAGPLPIAWAGAEGSSGQIRVDAVTVVDTLAAGDVLHGVLAALIAGGRAGATRAAPLDHATVTRWLADAARVASASCAYRGSRSWLAGSIARPALGPA